MGLSDTFAAGLTCDSVDALFREKSVIIETLYRGGSLNLRKGGRSLPSPSSPGPSSLPFPFPLIIVPFEVGPLKPIRGSGEAL